MLRIFGGVLLPLLYLSTSFSQSNKALIDKGRRVYMSNCIQCHNKDPNLKGPLGPELIDAPLEIMQVKVVTGRYPEVLPKGFVPKRKTKAMRALPKLKDDVPALYAWIQSMKKPKAKQPISKN